MIKKNLFSLFFLLIVTTPFFIRYLIINQKINILNRIYFNSPALLTSEKVCPSYDELLNKSLDSSYSVSIINSNGKIVSSFNDEVLRLPA